jgi:hypothetical protein
MQRLEDYKPPGNPIVGLLVFILFWVGIVLMFFSGNLYDDVAMPEFAVAVLLIAPAIILTPLLFNSMASKKLKGIAKGVVLFFANIFAFGSTLLYCALAIDYYQAPAAPVITSNYLITAVGRASRRWGDGKTPFAEISYKSYAKQFNFPLETIVTIKSYKYIQLQTTPGFLGFDVIKSKKLVK